MDVISNMLTMIRNAGEARHEKVDIPKSNLKLAITNILEKEGFIKSYKEIKDNKQGLIRIILNYSDSGEHVIRKMEKVSKCSLRQYVGSDHIPRINNGLGVAIISTSKGVMTDKEARRQNCGGEFLCYVW
jgi:small subunit ribosomal protein S8